MSYMDNRNQIENYGQAPNRNVAMARQFGFGNAASNRFANSPISLNAGMFKNGRPPWWMNQRGWSPPQNSAPQPMQSPYASIGQPYGNGLLGK